MAEAAGLALGGIALASLVTTCVEFLEYFEDCRNCIRDVTIAVTKVKLLKVRLHQLGSIGHLPVQYCLLDLNTKIFHHDWEGVSDALPDGASVIKLIIQETTHLCKRYKYSSCPGASLARGCTQASLSPSHQRPDSSRESSPPGRRAVLHTIARSVSWAFHDKKRFNGLISDFDFILSNLEKIIEGFQSKKTESYRETATAVHQSNTSKKMDGSQNWYTGSPAPGTVVSSTGVHVSTLQGCILNYENNETRGSSSNYVGVAVQGAATATFKGNTSHDQGIAVTGPMDGRLILALEKQQHEVKMKAVGAIHAAQKPVRGALFNTIIDFSKLTGKNAELGPESVETKGERKGRSRKPGYQ